MNPADRYVFFAQKSWWEKYACIRVCVMYLPTLTKVIEKKQEKMHKNYQ